MSRGAAAKHDSKEAAKHRRQNWETPWYIVERLAAFMDAEFGIPGPFTLDTCALKSSAKADTYYSKIQNGLRQPWFGKVWTNPPYGERENGSAPWVRKQIDEHQERRYNGACMLLPASNTDRHDWHTHLIPYMTALVLFDGRIPFEYKGTPYKSSDISNAAAIFVPGVNTKSPPLIYSMSSKP